MSNEKAILLDFLKEINQKNYAGAEKFVQLAVESKIKERIRKAIKKMGKKCGCEK